MEISTIILILVVAAVFYAIGRLAAELTFQKRLKEARKDATKRSRAVIGGQFSEQLAPFLPDFPYAPTEVKFLGKPADFIVFEGLDEKNINNVVFLEIKSGDARLSATEKTLQSAVKNGKVSFETYRIPKEVTHG